MPQLLYFPLRELEATAGVGGDDTDPVAGALVDFDLGVGQRPVRGRERQPGHPVGLREQPAGHVFGIDEIRDLAGQPAAVALRIETLEVPDPVFPAQHRSPVLIHPETDGCRDPESGHDILHRVTTGRGSLMIIALWNPPKPLPTLSTDRSRASRASSGT